MKWKNFWLPTPRKFRRLGNALLSISSLAGIPAVFTQHEWIGVSLFIIGLLGKFLTNLYAITPPTPKDDKTQPDNKRD